MAKKRIRMVRKGGFDDTIRLLYDDGTQGEIFSDKLLGFTSLNSLVGLTLKQAKDFIGIKK